VNGAAISPAGGDAGMASRFAVTGVQTPCITISFSGPSCASARRGQHYYRDRGYQPGLPRSEVLTRMERALSARSSGFSAWTATK